MKDQPKSQTKTWLAVVFVLVLIAALLYHLHQMNHPAGSVDHNTQESTVNFLGETLEVPAGWSVYQFGTRNGTLTLTRPIEQSLNSMLTLEDERNSPEIASQFVSGWLHSVGLVPGFTPQSLKEYHDQSVDAANLRCVAMHWNGPQRPYRIICLASNGRWKLTLSGEEEDTAAFDTMAQQLPGFIRGV